MSKYSSEHKLTLSAERLYLELMYCRADAQLGEMPYIAHLLNLACEELQKLADVGKYEVAPPPDWNAFHIYPDMK